MCNAFNHSEDCGCGFGGDTGGAATGHPFVDEPSTFDYPRDMRRLAISLGRTLCFGASCWYCARFIYLYANSHGGFAIFDAKGSPWPKHFCTGYPRSDSPYRWPPGVALRRGTWIPVPDDTPLVQPADGFAVRGVVTADRFVFTGSELLIVRVPPEIATGTWIEGRVAYTEEGHELVEVRESLSTPPPDSLDWVPTDVYDCAHCSAGNRILAGRLRTPGNRCRNCNAVLVLSRSYLNRNPPPWV